MIRKENLKQLLNLLHYSTYDENMYVKNFEDASSIMVDLKNEKIYYPQELKVNDKTTSNFEHPENFVVFECVDRLLSKGYMARNLEMEPRWQLGRGASGGKADILVKDNHGHEYLIIECKTYGIEYDSAWNDTLSNGAQLFSYAQQVKRTNYLCLYTSNIDDGKIVYKNKIITIKDNEEYLKTLKLSNRKRFKDASDVKELYKVWKDIYNCEAEETGIFEDGIQPYKINKLNSYNDLKTINFEDTQKKYNEFATILRQHNVSGHENAFDKLVNIFLAKIVDEIQHPNGLKFNWKGIAYDDYYQLQDRLQKLYKDGMQKFLNEEVTYIDDSQINNAFRLFKNDLDATKDTVLSYFRELKFYTNNDFSFIDVHNEELFKENSEILLKIVRMFQEIKLKTDEQNQFLGDLFEGFLDDGIKQSEGQFFTPLPITRFIVSALPLKEIIENLDEPPKVIDYACGAGHFLNEYASQIKKYVNKDKLHEYYAAIDGIEKEYRLSKVSKVSAFMYGQDDINITYGDALSDKKNIQDGQYDILIANPPYSVKGFLETLTDEERHNYDLIKYVSKNAFSSNNSIETFFIERAKQLLKPGGVAGIILPASILTNSGSLYTKAREIILHYFDIVSIVELPSGTFGATGTNTVTLFLKKKEENPSLATHYKNRVNAWFSGNFENDKVFEDKDILLEYLKLQNYEYDDYIELLINKNITDKLKENEIIKSYLDDSKVKEINKILEIEKDKLYHYMLASNQKNNVLVVNAPSSKDEVKKYLGYEWSNRKGSEGIKYIGANNNDNESTLSKNRGIKNIVTPLFNPSDLLDDSKINKAIKCNFLDEEFESEYNNISRYCLIDLLNFKKTNFDKAISLYKETNIEIKSKYDSDLLGSICDITIGGTPARAVSEYFQGNNLWVSIKEMNGQIINDTNEKITDDAIKNSNVKLIPKGTTLLSFKLSIGKTAIAGQDLYTNEAIAGLIPKNKKQILDKYLFYVFNTNILNTSTIGNKAFGKSLNSTYLRNNVKIPVPPIEVQQQIIEQCEKVDNECSKIIAKINEYKNTIEQAFIESRQSSNNLSIRLDNSDKFKLSIGNRVLKSELKEDGIIPVISANVKENFGMVNDEIITDYSKPYILWGIDGDWMVNYLEKGIKFYPTDHCGYIQVLDDNINPIYFAKALEAEGAKQRFSRSNRASTDRISSLVVKLPDIKIQNQIAETMLNLGSKIKELEIKLNTYDGRKKEVVEKYLN